METTNKNLDFTMNNNAYIYSFEGKDIFLARDAGYEIKDKKKFKATFDDCLDMDELPAAIFYRGKDGKKYTKAIVSLSFEYSVKTFNPIYHDKQKVFVKSYIKDGEIYTYNVENLQFENGIAFIDDDLVAVIVDRYIMIDSEFTNTYDEFSVEFSEDKKQFKWIANVSQFKTILKAKSSDSDDEKFKEKDNLSVRHILYKNGFTLIINDQKVKYVRFKRTTGSAREGRCLFIEEQYYDAIMNWSYMEVKPAEDEKCDLAGLEASIALTCSSIIDRIQIDPKSILVIDDYKSVFTDSVLETRIVDGTLCTEINEMANITNNIWDGQSLLDFNVFGSAPDESTQWVNGKYADKGFLLLRNRYFKSACFQVNLQKWFKDNNITDISQLKGFTLADSVDQIRMITTNSSIKYSKYGRAEDYLQKVGSTFGIVKFEKPTHYFNGDLVQSHYQLLQTLQLSYDDVQELVKPSFDYLKKLKADLSVFRYHLEIKIQNDIKMGDFKVKDKFIFTLLQVNNKIAETNLFYNFRQDQIKSYVKNMRKGHLLLPGTYAVVLGNGLEMLKASIGKFDGTSSILPNQIICKNFDTKKNLVGSRSPHICSGNLIMCTVVEDDEVDKYFKLSKQIVYLSSIKNNILQRCNGMDFDSDAIALIDSDILYRACEKNYNNFLVPAFEEESSKKGIKTPRYNAAWHKADLDEKTHSDMIGRIVNGSQYLNSLMWDSINDGLTIDSDEIKEIYTDVCKLAIASNIAIDRAKREFPVDLNKELVNIMNKYVNIDIDKSKKIKPLFFKAVNVDKKYYKTYKNNYSFVAMHTSMDYLQGAIDKGLKNISDNHGKRGTNKIYYPLIKILDSDKTIKLADADRNQIDNIIIPMVEKFKTAGDAVWDDDDKESEKKYEEYKALKEELFNNITQLRIKQATVKKILFDIARGKYSKIQMTLLTALYNAKQSIFITMFMKIRDGVPHLKRSNNDEFDLELYGIKFIKSTLEA